MIRSWIVISSSLRHEKVVFDVGTQAVLAALEILQTYIGFAHCHHSVRFTLKFAGLFTFSILRFLLSLGHLNISLSYWHK